MIEDLLDVSRIEARRLVLRLQPVDLSSLVPAVVERLVAGVRADPGRIEQVLGNLLSNAAKYGDPNSEIIVSL